MSKPVFWVWAYAINWVCHVVGAMLARNGQGAILALLALLATVLVLVAILRRRYRYAPQNWDAKDDPASPQTS